MSRGMGSLTCLFLIGSLFHVVAIDHKVGGDFGWNLPPTLTFYSEWARNNTFFIDDTLRFVSRLNETHTFSEANSKKDFDECVKQGIVFDTSINFTLQNNRLGPRYFVCTDGNHCDMGMKFTIEVLPKSVIMPNTAVENGVLRPILFFITIIANLVFL
ncbi:umecyanin-like [Cucumis sativus]|uniref:umecyanin-like n=1 Tax=Cucumis sativus TaxID=3659 RepID=UPI0012F4E537|nr:umecyanin-like [Cucumis sativus]